MRGYVLVVATLILLLVIAVAGATALIFDNSGGGTWREYMSFPITTVPSEHAQYKIVINGTTWEIYNVTGALEATSVNNNFWSWVNSTGADIRVFNQSSQLYFWIEKWDYANQTAIIWVNVTAGSTELNIAYGNPSASPSAYNNGTKTFEFFDDFNDGVLDTTKWTYQRGTWAESGGYVYVTTSAGTVPGNWLRSNYYGSRYVVETSLILSDTSDTGLLIHVQGDATQYATLGAPVAGTYDTLLINEWSGTAWGTATTTPYNYIAGERILLKAVVNGTSVTIYDLTHGVSVSRTLTYASGYLGLHQGASFTTSGKFDWIFVAKLADPVNFGAPVIRQFGKLLEKGLLTNVTYLSKSLPSDTLYVKVTYLNAGTVSSYNPIMTYIPYGNVFNASASIDVTGVNTTLGANITIMLDANKTLTAVVYNNSVRTANLTSLGTEIINGKTYNVWNLTVYENGTLTIYALTDPIVETFKGITLKPQYNVKNLTCSFLASVTGVNATYGANITFKLNANLTLVKVIYNNTDVTSNITYIRSETIDGQTYNVWNLTVYENGTLNITASIANVGLNTTFKLDGNAVNISTVPAVIGEVLDVNMPWTGNITIGKTQFTNVSYTSINTKDIGVGTFNVVVTIEDAKNWKFGYLSRILNVTYGRLNVTVVGINSKPFGEAVVSAYNEKYGLLSMNFKKLWAGWQRIDVFFRGIRLKTVRFYLNHTTTGANITIYVNATTVKDYRGLSRVIASPNSFEVINLSARYPYSVMKICNCSGTVIIDYTSNPPTAVDVEGATSYSYEKPVLKITVDGIKNVTVTDLYKLTAKVKDRLGNPLNFYVTINGSRVDASNGVVSKLLKPSWYKVSVPITVAGFELWMFNNTSNVALVEVNTSDVTLPTAEYRVPTKIITNEVRIQRATTLFPWLPIPFPSKNVRPKQGEMPIVRLEGSLKDFYNAPVPNRTVIIKIISPNYTRIYNVTTDSAGNFRIDIDLVKGVKYKITYEFAGDDVYVGTTTTKTFMVEQLPPAPPAPVTTAGLLFVAIAVGVVAVIAGIIYLSKRTKAQMRAKMEREFRFFRRLR